MRATPRACLSEQTRTANRAVTRFYERHLKDCDIGIAQLALLVRLYYVPDIGMGRLAADLEVDRTTLARNVKTLVTSGHLAVAPGADRRARRVQLTDKGYASLRHALPLWQKAQAEMHAMLGTAGWTEAMQTLRGLVEAAGPPDDAA